MCSSLLPFVLDDLFRDEVEEHNSTADKDKRVEDPSTELVGVANTFIAWYKLYRRMTPGKGLNDVDELTGLCKQNMIPYLNRGMSWPIGQGIGLAIV